MMFSVYLSMKSGNGTHVKLGGYDVEGMDGGVDSLQIIETVDNEQWILPLSHASIGYQAVQLQATQVIFELAYPYIYLPMEDYNSLVRIINTQYGGSLCVLNMGKCLIKQSCDQIDNVGSL